MKTKVSFRVIVNPSILVKIGDFMSRCDLGISRIERLETYNCSWLTSSLVDKKYLSRMKRRLKQAFEMDGSKVISIKKMDRNV